MIAVRECTMNEYVSVCLSTLLNKEYKMRVNTILKLTHYDHSEHKTFTMDKESTLLAIIRRAKKENNLSGKQCDMHHQGGCIVLVFDNAMLTIDYDCEE